MWRVRPNSNGSLSFFPPIHKVNMICLHWRQYCLLRIFLLAQLTGRYCTIAEVLTLCQHSGFAFSHLLLLQFFLYYINVSATFIYDDDYNLY